MLKKVVMVLVVSSLMAANVLAAEVQQKTAVEPHMGPVILTDEAYQSEFNQPNPNTELMAALKSAGVKIYVCGQSIGIRRLSFENLNPAVSVAISAMSAHVRLQSEGFTVIPF